VLLVVLVVVVVVVLLLVLVVMLLLLTCLLSSGTPVQAWTKPDGLKACGLSTTNCTTEKGGNCSHYPSTLYNHMVMPFVGYGLRSVLWYQVRNIVAGVVPAAPCACWPLPLC